VSQPTRYPLAWPEGVKRTPVNERKKAAFSKKGDRGWREQLSMYEAGQRLQSELDAITKPGQFYRTKDAILSTNIETRIDGMPRFGQRPPDDCGVAFYFKLDGKPHVMPCDKWNRAEDNVAAIAKHIEAIRMMEHWGVGDIAQMFTGFSELPAPDKDFRWWDVLGVDRQAEWNDIRQAYRELAAKNHPDQEEGSDDAMARINVAYSQAKKEKNQ
jgi:hypothetical protein